jgi:ubiquinone/menaquinone biosynthesis C-methylase UbiE
MSTIKDSVHDQFAAVAANYRTSAVHATGADLAQIVALVAERNQPLVLDVGCGGGHVTAAVAPASRAVVACDLTPAMLAQVEQLCIERGLGNVRTQQADVEALPFDDHSFDLVVSRYSAHHWPNPQQGVAECLRVLRPGGTMLLSDIVAPEQPALDTFLQTVEYLRDRSHVRDHRVSEWVAMFGAAGALAQPVLAWNLALDFEAWVARMATPPAQVAILRTLFASASAELRNAFQIADDYSFAIPGVLLQVNRRGESGK